MTEKQKRIIATALHLFAEQGYDAVSTSRIAEEANVSEGLIFRHFDNKQGLLDAIMASGKEKIMDQLEALENEKDPCEILRKAILLPFEVKAEEYLFWRLYYALKWQTVQYDYSILQPLKERLTHAFHQLEYEEPEAEAEIVSLWIDGAATAILLRDLEKIDKIKTTILKKYNLEPRS